MLSRRAAGRSRHPVTGSESAADLTIDIEDRKPGVAHVDQDR
jgi:hypothetical protein